jgi:predicted ATPase/class 3 adenylate cyclase
VRREQGNRLGGIEIGSLDLSRRRHTNNLTTRTSSRHAFYPLLVAEGMAELPEGTVTMLFSDIEGSTALLSRLGDSYAEVLSAQRALLRDAFGAAGGREMGTEGDSFFVVFRSAVDAVCCCIAAQRALAGYSWPGGVTVRVRMGMHSGEPVRHEDGYVGMDVHRAARIAATAHGGQVVVSDATRHLAESRLPADVSVLDLGWHRLKDIEAPEHIYQLIAAGLEERFPPLRSLGAKTSLPLPMTTLVGRDGELAQLRAAVLQPGVRLVTLTGAGGVGKTRLALAAASSLAEAFQHGAFFVALAPAEDTSVMWRAIADGLNVGDDGAPVDAVTEHLRDRATLLLLDNLEHLHGAAEVVAALLAAAPGLTVLATSRRPLHLHGEHEQPVPPLDVPTEGDIEAVAASAAARLFVQQADMVRPGFAITEDNSADVAAICRRLDGLPLAIELAASRAKLLAPRALLARLGQSLGLASGDLGRPSRHQTLRATIAWSCDLLTADLALVFRRSGVFSGGCDLAALAAIAGDDQPDGAGPDSLQRIADLLDVSLITVTDGVDGEPRAAMLETIREYALELLEQSGELEITRRRHADYYVAFAERLQEQLPGPARLTSLDHLEAEHDNMRAALNWSLRTSDGNPANDDAKAVIGVRLVRALGPFWYQHGHATEGRGWLEQAIALAPDDAGAPLAHVVHWLGVLLQQQGENGAALPLFERSFAIWRDLGDLRQTARELNSLGITHSALGHVDTARSLLADSITICRELGASGLLASALTTLGHLETSAGNLDSAAAALTEALAVDRAVGDEFGATIDQQGLALTSLFAGRAAEAAKLLSSTVDYVVASGDIQFLANTVELAAAIAACLGDSLRAARLCGAAAGIRQTASMPISPTDDAVLERFVGPARASVARLVWDAETAAGRALTRQQAITLVEAPPA